MSPPPIALVVEDDELQRELLCDFLKDEHMDVIQCESAEAAELIIARVGAELSLLVTDFRVILMSGENSLRIPADVRFLQKPFHPGELLAA
jgi:DNA-binding response OmpR family regulator